MEQMDQAARLARNNELMARYAARRPGEKDPPVYASPWVRKLSEAERWELYQLIFNYDSWTEETDPTGTHAAGVVEFRGHCILWVIRHHNPNLGYVLELDPPIILCLIVAHSSEI